MHVPWYVISEVSVKRYYFVDDGGRTYNHGNSVYLFFFTYELLIIMSPSGRFSPLKFDRLWVFLYPILYQNA